MIIHFNIIISLFPEDLYNLEVVLILILIKYLLLIALIIRENLIIKLLKDSCKSFSNIIS